MPTGVILITCGSSDLAQEVQVQRVEGAGGLVVVGIPEVGSI